MPRYGAIADRLADVEFDNRQRHVAGLVGRSSEFPSERDWSPLLDHVLDQGQTSACVAHWFSSALYLAGQASGHPVPRPSRRWSYAVARYTDTPGELVDEGCRPRACVLGATKHGIVAETRLPWDPGAVDEPPPLDADTAGQEALFTGYYRADAGDVPTLLRLALYKGHFPGLSMAVHQAFEDLDGREVYDEPSGEELGRHMVTLVAYRPGAFRILNSWGTSWADSGFCWVSDRFVASHYVSDRYVVTCAPLGR